MTSEQQRTLLRKCSSHKDTVYAVENEFNKLKSLISYMVEDSDFALESLDDLFDTLLDHAQEMDEEESSEEYIREQALDLKYRTQKEMQFAY